MKHFKGLYILFAGAFMLFTSLSCKEEYFEGVVSYKISAESLIKGQDAKSLKNAVGTKSEFYFKNGDYKQTHNGLGTEIEYFNHNTNKYYSRELGNDTFVEEDWSIKTHTVLTIDNLKSVKKIAGYDCDEIVIHSLSIPDKIPQTFRFFYNSNVAMVDPEWFSKANSNLVANVYQITKAIPLEISIETSQIKIEITATKIKSQSLKADDLLLPKGAKTKVHR